MFVKNDGKRKGKKKKKATIFPFLFSIEMISHKKKKQALEKGLDYHLLV
jgi:hypothetical protein